jgi:predicted dehydrogenase
MNRPLRVAVIGVGFGQQVHVPAFRADSRCEVTTLCASTEAKAAEVARRLGVPRASGDWRSLIADPDIDAVSIAVPPRLQPQIVLDAIEHGKSAFCEKPFAAHAFDLIPLCESKRTSLRRESGTQEPGSSSTRRAVGMVNFEFCECDAWHKFLQLVNCPLPGRGTSVEINWRVQTYSNKRRIDNWKSRPEEGGGALQGFAAHSYYLLEQLRGPICRLKAQLSKAADDPRSGETNVDLEIEFFFGGTGSVHIATDAPPPHHHQIDFIDSQRVVRLLNEGSDYVRGFELYSGFDAFSGSGRVGELERVFPEAEPSSANGTAMGDAAADITDGRIEATSRLVRKFIDWVLGGSPAHPDFFDGYRVQTLIEAARRSNAEGRWMDTNE